ncbi:MAG TPA: GAF domain-containing sensor histidine kinase [Bryobacteraceae bacterium]|nr:GAF domain-containing sensor histidine kinase [Bryobacteraceae bacterium]
MAARDLRQRVEELAVVAEIASAMLSPLELRQVLDVALEKASRAIGAPSGSITLLTPAKDRLEFAAVYGLSPGYGDKFRQLGLLPADDSSPSGRAVSTGKTYWVRDVNRHPLCKAWKHITVGEGVRALISVPLVVGGEPLGTLNQYMAEPHRFRAPEVRLLEVVAQQISLAIERARLYDRLKQQHEAVSAASDRKSRFLASMSHELRSPLTAIVGFADLLGQQIPGSLNAAQLRQVQMIAASAKHIMAVVNDALDVARIEAGKLECLIEPVDAAEVISEVSDMMQPLARAKHLALNVSRPAEPLILRCDRQRSKQILVNLVSNAIKFTARGHIDLSGVRDASVPHQARIMVSDTGIGVPADQVPLLFQEFQQLPTPFQNQGAGLGLAISRKLARLMGGDIEVQSDFGRGSTFTLKLETA